MKPSDRVKSRIFLAFFLLAFAAAGVVLALSISSADAAFVLPIFAAIFILTAVFYLSPAYPWFHRPGVLWTIGLILLLVLPAALLTGWLAFVRDYRTASLGWFAPMMGMGVGLNLRSMREKNQA